jgi:sulfide:quinone oxidoreductase
LLRRGIEFVQGNVDSIDPTNRTVTVGEQRFAADAIVIALGAELAPEAIPGLVEAGHNFYQRAEPPIA